MNLYLIGYRGSGKSTVAPLVAKLLDLTSVDTDQLIEETSGTSIAEIFASQGEPGFRQLESEALRKFSKAAHLVISLGGGAPVAEANRKWMEQNGKTVWLTAKPELLWQRISSDVSSPVGRPALTDHDGLTEVRQLVTERNPVYMECADYTIEVASMSPEQIAAEIACWWNSVDKN